MAIQKISNAVLGTGSVNATSIATGGVTLGDIPDAEITLAKLHTDVQTPINAVAGKQATIVSGTHIKTINSVSIVGSEVVECDGQKNLKIVDLTGAGDLFAAGFLHGYINKMSTKESLEKGTEMASKVIQKIGARLN